MKLFQKKEPAADVPQAEETKKKEKEPKEPQYYKSATNIQTLNYNVYYMSKLEKLLYALLAFAVGAFVGSPNSSTPMPP